MVKILIVDDQKNLLRTLSIALEDNGHEIAEASSGKEAMELIEKDIYDIVLTDLVMEEIDGIELLRQVKSISPTTEVILMSAYGTIDQAVDAIKQGAFDFIVKPFSTEHLEMLLEKAMNQLQLKQTIKHLKSVLADRYSFQGIVAESDGMKEIMHQIAPVAGSTVPVLIQGESGVGKELLAISIHNLSERADAPFVAVNCGAFPDTLLDSELFGHIRGSFTGAVAMKRGLIEEADKGTLFLDEIGEAPPAFQVRLLRFLDNGLFRRVGEVEERRSDVRIIAATNKNLTEDIEQSAFREDLYYRLSVANLTIPPLRERREDIPVLCTHFLKKYSQKMGKEVNRLHPAVHAIFRDYSWPGNVRELENTLEHALIITESNEIRIQDLPRKFGNIELEEDPYFMKKNMPLKELEKHYILSVLERTNQNRKRAAEILEISRTTLISKIKSYEIE